MTDFVVMGGGIAGLGTALMLTRRGHTVTLFEKDARAPGGDLDADFFDWPRARTVPQAVQPHTLLGASRAVLIEELPDVYEELLRLGASEYHEMGGYEKPPEPVPGDANLVMLQPRRILLETVLYDALRAEPGAVLRYGEQVSGLLFGPPEADGTPRVTGVRTAAGEYRADVVVDTAGRRGGTAAWLTEAGGRPPVVENHRTGVAYYCRWYRLAEGVAPGPQGPSAVNGSSFGGCAVFPADNRVFGVLLFLHTDDPTRAALTDPEVFEAAAGVFPAAAAWQALDSEPLSGVLPMAGLENRWCALVDEEGPVVTGLLGVGDSFTHTNPTMAQGISLALWAGQWVARHASSPGAEAGSAAFTAAYHAWALGALRPWFDVQVETDTALGRRYAERIAGPPTGFARQRAAMVACGRTDPVVGRARARVRHLLELPGKAYGGEEVRRRLSEWLAENPGWEPGVEGPEREEWEKVIEGR
ncbi:FAD-dependent oxidoreductase [Streptomyces sp. NBC_00237]|uniref:NAD(P)/FAD-dependent oxidoreductase n=1 Tax=Streptomyces sp. NBC_00237 TaxID=2975687 RepID=UPI00225B8920|nr:FAD-dependent oxidoreductase [Streptomyces sp. NBC_00237]MCX5202927.1 FAD-dependent oxidoreductase [Streptomyces sp. NBC_00237]